jgi:hypothetical protein
VTSYPKPETWHLGVTHGFGFRVFELRILIWTVWRFGAREETMQKKMKTASMILLFFTLGACAPPITQEAKQDLQRSIDCTTAQDDIAVLQSEKSNVNQQMLAGVTSMLPTAAVMGLLTGRQQDREEVLTGQYNDMIDQKIDAIRRTCRVQ